MACFKYIASHKILEEKRKTVNIRKRLVRRMAILFQEEKRIFTLQTKQTTYQMKVDDFGFLLHLYYGTKVSGDMDYLLTYYDRGFREIRMMWGTTGLIPWTFCHRNIRLWEQEITETVR